MILALILIVFAGVVGLLMFVAAVNGYSNSLLQGIGGVFGFFICASACLALLGYGFLAYSWFGADYKAKIINREYGTAYTREEVFFGADVIDTIRELDRSRLEVNGNIMQAK